MQLEDRIVLITGGASGLGEGIALVLADRGADVAVCDINLTGAQQTADEVRGVGRRAEAYQTDVTSQPELNDLVEAVLAEFGRIDILVNAAGVIGAPGFEDTTASREADWDLTYDVNVKGTVLASDAVSPHMVGKELWQDSQYLVAWWSTGRRRWGCIWRFKGCRDSPDPVVCYRSSPA